MAKTVNPLYVWRRIPSGFSLLELLAVVTLIGILIGIILIRIANTMDGAKEKTCIHNKAQLNAALERFAVSSGNYATSLSDIDTDDYFPSGIPACKFNGSAYALNTTTHRIEGHTPGSH